VSDAGVEEEHGVPDGAVDGTVFERLRTMWREAAESGTNLPPEPTLATLLGVSRPTVREALIRLEAEGLIRRRAGSGTFPNASALSMPVRIDLSFEFSDMLREAGLEPAVEVLSAGWRTLGADDAADLDVDAGLAAYGTVKRWTADGVPVMVATDVVPVLRRPPVEPDPHASVFDLAGALRHETVEWECGWVDARAASPDEAELLDLAVGAPVLGLKLLGFSRSGARLFRALEVHRQGTVGYGLIRTVRR
jgi:GntR family transcriptional regulator